MNLASMLKTKKICLALQMQCAGEISVDKLETFEGMCPHPGTTRLWPLPHLADWQVLPVGDDEAIFKMHSARTQA